MCLWELLAIEQILNYLNWHYSFSLVRIFTIFDFQLKKSGVLLHSFRVRNIKIILIEIFCFFSFYAPAQNAIRFDRFSTLDGLGSNTIFDIVQDDKGFLWFATYDGLSRYNGYDFENFKPDQNNHGLIGSNIINVLELDSLGQIWYGTTGTGLSVFNPVTGYFKNYQAKIDNSNGLSDNNVFAICHIGKKVWIGTTVGLDILDLETDSISSYSLIDFGVSNNIKAIIKDTGNCVWVGTTRGAVLLKGNDTGLSIGHSFLLNQSIFSGNINKLHIDGLSNLWTVTANKIRSIHYEPASGFKEIISLDVEEVFKKTGIRTIFNTLNSYTTNNFWVGTENGLFNFDTENNSIIWSQNERFNSESLSGNRVLSLLKDREGLLWVGTRLNGVNKIDPYTQPFARFMEHLSDSLGMMSNDVRTIAKDSKGNLWIGYRNEGLDCYKINQNKYVHFKHITEKKESLPSNIVRCVYEDRKGRLWLGTSAGLSQIIPNGTSFRFKSYSEKLAQHIEDLGVVYEIMQDSKDCLWLGTTRGLIHYDIDRNSATAYLQENSKMIGNRNFIRSIAEDQKGHLWVATDGGGIAKLNPESEQFINYQSCLTDEGSLSHNKVYCLLFDSQNHLWAGTHSGLNRMNEDGSFTVFDETMGLANNLVYSILEDEKGDFWISTANGLSRFNPKKGVFNNYLQGFEFSDDAWWQSTNGEIYMGGLNGFFKFYPNQIKDNLVPPIVSIVGMSLQNKKLNVGEDIDGGGIILSKPISETKQLDLAHNQNFFSFDLLAISLSKPNQVKYQYQLEGFNASWVDVDPSVRSAVFTNVPYGKYRFKVHAANADGIWSDEKYLTIFIRPAYYQTALFKLATAFIIILLIFIGYRLRLRNLMLQKKRLIVEVEEKTKALRLKKEAIEKQNLLLKTQKIEIENQRDKVLEMTGKIHAADEQKMWFFTNISHEIRTPLTLIAGPVEQIMESMTETDSHFEKLLLVKKNTQRLLKLVNQLLDFRKIDTGHMPVQKSIGDLKSFIVELFKAFVNQAQSKKINYLLEIEDVNFMTFFDADVLEKIVTNLLSNAIKYTPIEGEVRLVLKKGLDKSVLIQIKDTGPGINPDQRQKVFERFYRDKKLQNGVPGVGIGLSLVKELVELHGGSISVENNHEGGSCFCVQFTFVDADILLNHSALEVVLPDQIDNQMPIVSNDYTVLIIEDNDDLRSFIKNSITAEEIFEAKEGDEGIRMALDKLPDIIISDVLMPGKNGFDVCRFLKANSLTNHIPIFLLTALANEENQEEGIGCGADDYIFKPFNHRILNGKIRNVMLARHRFKLLLEKELTNVSSYASQEWKGNFSPFICKIIEAIEVQMANSSFGVEELGKQMGMSRTTLYRKLKAVTDKNAVEFIREVRIRKSLELLQVEPHLLVAELAFKVGFEDVDYFRQCFKKQFGKTPKEIVHN